MLNQEVPPPEVSEGRQSWDSSEGVFKPTPPEVVGAAPSAPPLKEYSIETLVYANSVTPPVQNPLNRTEKPKPMTWHEYMRVNSEFQAMQQHSRGRL